MNSGSKFGVYIPLTATLVLSFIAPMSGGRAFANGSWGSVDETFDTGSGIDPDNEVTVPGGYASANISGSHGSMDAHAQALDLTFGDSLYPDVDSGVVSGSGWRMKVQQAFVPGAPVTCNSPPGFNPPTYQVTHGAPGNAIMLATCGGSAECTITMDCDNGVFSTDSGAAYAFADAEVAFSGLASASAHVSLADGFISEGATTVGGSFSKGPPEVSITGTISGKVATATGTQSCSNSVTSPPCNITGMNERGSGYVAVRAAIYDGAHMASARATTSVSTLTLTKQDGGTATNCEFDGPHGGH